MGQQFSGFSDVIGVRSSAFGNVYRGREKSSERTRTIKARRLCRSAITEIVVLHRLPDHPHIVDYIEYFISGYELCLVMEYCSGGNLNDYLLSHQPNSSRDLRFMTEIASAVAFLHRHGVVHRDLKPDNILLTSNDTLKVADFGNAKLASDSQHDGRLYKYYMDTQCGTPLFVAPEVYDEIYTEKSDVFSMGIIFASILQRTVWQRKVAVYAYHQGGGVQAIGEALHTRNLKRYCLSEDLEVSQSLRYLIESMLDNNHHNRRTAREVEICMGNIQNAWVDTVSLLVLLMILAAVVVFAAVVGLHG